MVIISLWRSKQLRKQLCYFMILVLSCFDLVAVAIISALLILSTMLWSIGNSTSAFDHTRLSLAIHLGGCAADVECRFLFFSFPFCHQSAVTKTRITTFLVFWIIVQVTLSLLFCFYGNTILMHL